MELAYSPGKKPGARPVLITLDSPSERLQVFEKSKSFTAMGLTVSSDRSKLERQARRQLLQKKSSLIHPCFEVIVTGNHLQYDKEVLSSDDTNAMFARPPSSSLETFLEVKDTVKRQSGRPSKKTGPGSESASSSEDSSRNRDGSISKFLSETLLQNSPTKTPRRRSNSSRKDSK